MELILYRQTNKDNKADKISTNCQTIATFSDVTPYLGVSQDGATFVLDKAYDVNYAKYNFNGKVYYGFVDVSVNTEGLYKYNVRVDPLTTIWKAGHFAGTNQYIVREMLPDATDALAYVNHQKDNDLSYSPVLQTIIKERTLCRDYSYIVNIIKGKNTNISIHPNTNSATESYVLTPDQYEKFRDGFQNLPDYKQIAYQSCIASIYLINNDYISENARGSKTNGSVTLYRINTSSMSSSGKSYPETEPSDGSIYIPNIYDLPVTETGTVQIFKASSIDPTEYAVDYTFSNSSLTLNATTYTSSICLQFREQTNIKFSPALLKIPERTINSIGYRAYLNPVAGNMTYELMVNGAVYPVYRAIGSAGVQIPFLSDNSVFDWVSANNSIESARTQHVTNMCSSIASVVLSAGLAIATGGASAPITTLITAGAASSGVSSLFSAVKDQNTISNLNENTEAQSQYGGTGIIGSTTASNDMLQALPIRLVISYYEPLYINSYRNLYGRPSGLVKDISYLSGYVLTSGCRIESSYPLDIVSRACAACDSGIYI